MPPPRPEVIQPAGLAAPLGPYSHAIRFGPLVFCAGQLALDPESGAALAHLPADQQTVHCLHSLRVTLAAAGATLADVVRTTVYLTDLDDYALMNASYIAAMGEARPARATIKVAGLLGGLCVEIDAVAVVPGADFETA